MPPAPHWKAQQDTGFHQFSAKGQFFLINIAGGALVSHNPPWTGDQTGHTACSCLLESPQTSFACMDCGREHTSWAFMPETSEHQLQPVPAPQVTVHETNRKKTRPYVEHGWLLSLLLSAAVLSHIGQQTLRKRSQMPNTRLSPHGRASWWDWSVTSSDESKDAARVNIYCH